MADSSHLMPDTSGVNFYSADPDLALLLGRYLSAEDNHRAQGILTHMGAVASEQMDELAEIAKQTIYGYHAGRDFFFMESSTDQERNVTDTHLIEQLCELASEHGTYDDYKKVVHFTVGCILGELSGHLFF